MKQEFKVNQAIVPLNFSNLKEQLFEDASVTFFEEDGASILKQERVSVSQEQAFDKRYSINFDAPFTDGDLEVCFQLKRGGGNHQIFCIRPSCLSEPTMDICFGEDSLTVGDTKLKMDSTDVKPVKLSAGEWYDVSIKYSLSSFNGFGISVALSGEGGKLHAAVAKTPTQKVITSLSGLDLIDFCTTNIADCRTDASEHPTSVWYMKNLTATLNPMKTGDRVKLRSTTFEAATGVQAQFLVIDGHHTVRPYFGRYSILPDNSGFVCSTTDNTMYLYEFATQELIYLDKSLDPGEKQLSTNSYVNPITGNLFYLQRNKAEGRVLYKMNLKTYEKTKLYESDNYYFKIFVEVTNDEKYAGYMLGGWKDANLPTYMGRINLETGELEYKQEIVYDRFYCVNHLTINPENPDLLFYRREMMGDWSVKDQSNLIKFPTGEVITYAQPGPISGHTLWTIDGKYLTLAVTDSFGILDPDLKEVKVVHGINATHPMADNSLTWGVGSYPATGVNLINLNNSSQKMRICDPQPIGLKKGHPYHQHNEISHDGKIIMWGHCDEDGILGIAWTNNPFLD